MTPYRYTVLRAIEQNPGASKYTVVDILGNPDVFSLVTVHQAMEWLESQGYIAGSPAGATITVEGKAELSYS